MLSIWAQGGTDQRRKTSNLEAVFAPIFKAYRPNIPKHRFIEFKEDRPLPEPEAGEVVIVCGNKPLDALRRAGVVHKNRTLGSLREKPIVAGAGHFLVTYDPFLVLNEPEKHQVVEWDIRLAHRLQTTGQLKPVVGDYKWVGSYQPMINEIEEEFAKTGKPVKVAFDSETMGLYPWYPNKDFVCISFTHRAGTAQLLYMGPKKHPVPIQPGVIEQIRWLLTSPKVRLRMANGKYDLIWVKEKWGLDCTNFTIDTLLVGSLLDENRTNSLNLHAKLFTDLGGYDDAFNAKYDKAHMERADLDDLLVYQGGDTDACYRAADVLQAELADDPELRRFYQVVLHPAARAFEKVERRGVLVDPQKFAVLRDDLKKVIAEAQKTQLDLLPGRLRAKFRERIDERLADGANPLLPSILQEYFFGETGLRLKPLQFTPTGKISLTKPHLRAVAEGRPEAAAFLKAMTEMDSAAKTLSTFVEGFLKHLRPDMRFHPSYMLFHGGFGDDGDDESGTVCVTADTLFFTDRGHVLFTELEIGDKVVSHNGVPRLIVDLVENGVKPVYRVRLSNGAEIDCTGNHPFRVGNQWVRADQLQRGQSVAVLPETEIWSEVDGWPFWVSTWGRVRSAKGTILAQQRKGSWGHLKVCLFRNGAQKRGPDRRDFPVHRLVAEAFIPNVKGFPEVRHKNGFAWDNRASNLLWGTAEENRRDMQAHCTGQGAHQNQSKIDWQAVADMRGSLNSDAVLAKVYGVSRELVRDIRNGKRWVVRTPAERSVQFSVASVVSVTYLGELPTYGATVEGDHSHVTNGIVTHNTGRLSAKEPAFQTIPKKTKWAKRLRECYIAPFGKVMVSIDYSQGELRVVACVAPERTMIQAYLNGLDLHAVTGAKLAQVPLDVFLTWKENEDKELAEKFDDNRGKAKPANFGLLYGMSAEGFQAYAWTAYGVKLTATEAEQMRSAFFELYPGLPSFHDKMRTFVGLHKHVRSPLGRVRHLPAIDAPDRETRSSAQRQAINSPIQSCLADMMEWAIALIDEEIGDDFEAVGNVHDALVGYIDADKVQTVLPQVTSIMSNLPLHKLGWKPELQFIVDAEVGPNMAALKKWKLAA